MEEKGSYRETIKIIKDSMNRYAIREGKLGIRSTRDGKNLVISTSKDTEILNKIQTSIRKTGEEVRVKKSIQRERNPLQYILRIWVQRQ